MKKQLFSFAAIWLCYMLCIASAQAQNKIYAAPLTVMRSDPLMSNKDEKINTYAVYGKATLI